MRIVRNIRIKNEANSLFTIGLKRITGFELKLLMREKDENQYIDLLAYLINYLIDYKPVINNGQTIAYHSWLLKFVIKDSLIDLFEVQPDGESFSEGVDYAITVVDKQKQECIDRNVNALFPLFSQMIVVSKGVLEGMAVDAVRYPSPNHMTGWWITTDLYDDDIKSLQTIHYYHLAFKRSDLIQYLALPFGYRFYSGEHPEVWFDEKVLS